MVNLPPVGTDGGFQLVMGVPLYRWMVFVKGKILGKADDDWGYPISGNPQILSQLPGTS